MCDLLEIYFELENRYREVKSSLLFFSHARIFLY
jgi:hypothetical protein